MFNHRLLLRPLPAVLFLSFARISQSVYGGEILQDVVDQFRIFPLCHQQLFLLVRLDWLERRKQYLIFFYKVKKSRIHLFASSNDDGLLAEHHETASLRRRHLLILGIAQQRPKIGVTDRRVECPLQCNE
jgi:hypothetical protein